MEEINAAQPDLVILPGDFIADRDYEPESAARQRHALLITRLFPRCKTI